MAKSVVISIRPEWVHRILSGEKTVEVRKTAPKIAKPFKCYIYETKGRSCPPWNGKDGSLLFRGRGAVVAEFVCNEIRCHTPDCLIINTDAERTLAGSCLTRNEVVDYLRGNSDKLCDFYGWHISDLKIYDKPKKISEFNQCHKCELHEGCKQHEYSCAGEYKLKRPPQSWCYVEGL